MKGRLRALLVLAALGVALLVAACGGDGGAEIRIPDEGSEQRDLLPAAWDYGADRGPASWGSLGPAYEACSQGERQSPIDLVEVESTAPAAIEFAYLPAQVEVTNDGHALDAEFAPGSAIEIAGTGYELDHLHLHAPSEHTIDGRSFPIELHFVNVAADGSAAVLGVLVEKGDENPAFAPLLRDLTEVEGETVRVPGGVSALDLLPPDPETAPRWSYQGSLTTPPCSEVVTWSVFAEPIELSTDQIARLTSIFDGNNRPVQPLNERRLLFGS